MTAVQTSVATARASLACYSTRQEIDVLMAGLDTVQEAFW